MTAKEKRLKRERLERAQRWAAEKESEWQWEPVDLAPHGIFRLQGHEKELQGKRPFLYARTSKTIQQIIHQIEGSLRKLADLGFHDVQVYAARGETGKSLRREDRPILYRAFQKTEEANWFLIAPCHTRLLRNKDFDATSFNQVYPTTQNWARFRKRAGSIPIYLLNNPTTTNQEDEDFLQSLNPLNGLHKERTRKKGYRAKRKEAIWETVVELASKGLSLSQIQKEILYSFSYEISRKTLLIWTTKGNSHKTAVC